VGIAPSSVDFTALERLRGAASKMSPGALREAAGQFEALLVQSMLKSMRSVSFSNGLFESSDTGMYRDMLDQQLALEMSRGRGIGLADMIARQLGHAEAGAANEPARKVALSARVDHARPLAGTAAQFVQQLMPHAREAARKLGVSAKAVLAQAALETGWGQRVPGHANGSTSFNLFGIKAGSSWRGDSVSVPTLEFTDDVPERMQARFRAYASPAASFQDYAELISSDPRYADALGRGDDVAGFARALQEAGYATDPDYARKLEEVAGGEQMRAALAGLED
jgi:flagellar protein FlgJ